MRKVRSVVGRFIRQALSVAVACVACLSPALPREASSASTGRANGLQIGDGVPAATFGYGAETGTDDGASPARMGASAEVAWPMAGANPQRTSWTAEEVQGALNPIWYRVVEPYIAPYVQIIAANGLLYIATSAGLYALNAASGATAWVYPTELPLGNSPTVFNGVVYVGGFDHRLYALNAVTGQLKWTYEAPAGFATNPLVLEIDGHTLVYAGNRDGRLYAVEDLGSAPALSWAYSTDGPILFSAAYEDGTVYIASDDSYAYALNARNGALVWKSPKLPGAGFHVWWPVVYQNQATGVDVVILAGSDNYRAYVQPAYGQDLQGRETIDVWPNRATDPRGTPIGARNPDGTVNVARILQYLEAKPWRRTYIVLDRQTGHEVTFDFDKDGKPEYAPVLWHGTHSGNRYPPVVGSDGLLYQSNTYMSDAWIPAGQVSGWTFGSSSISTPSAQWIAMDEQMAYSAGGNLVYWTHCSACGGGSAGAFDLSLPNTRYWPDTPDARREWVYYGYYGLEPKVPGYDVMYENNYVFQAVGASPNGVYGQNGYQNPPIPYAGRVYKHSSNAVIAFGNYDGPPTQLAMVTTVTASESDLVATGDVLRQKLASEVTKMLAAGHLRPGYLSTGLFDTYTRSQLGDYLIDYWHDPSDTLYTLILALPYLSPDLQLAAKTYLEDEFAEYPPYDITHIGWSDGAPREPYTLPQEAQSDLQNNPAWVSGWDFDGWLWPPQMFYALWKYAEVFGSAKAIFDASRSRLESAPSDAYLVEYPYVHNAYIAGYLGYLRLQTLAGYAESANVRAELTRLLTLRASTFNKDTPGSFRAEARALSIARNFMYLVPELGQYLHDTIYSEVWEALDEYSEVAPYWFVSDFNVTVGEGTNQPFFDYWALFQAKALILQESGTELVKYLDVPAVQAGDLYYIQNLVAVLDAGLESGLSKVGSATRADAGEMLTYTLRISGYTGSVTITDPLPMGVGIPEILAPEGTSVTPIYDDGTRRIVWHDDLSVGGQVTLRYRVTVTTNQPTVLRNTAELSGPGVATVAATFTVITNARNYYLPLVLRHW